jgi:mannose-1-phosphate guanylyltransferase
LIHGYPFPAATSKQRHCGLILAGEALAFRSAAVTAPSRYRVLGESTLIEATVERLSPPSARTLVGAHQFHLRAGLSGSCRAQKPVLAEPEQKNTAAAIGLGGAHSAVYRSGFGDGVFPSDHAIEKPRRHLQLRERSAPPAGKDCGLGITPRRPDTGYGYIEFPWSEIRLSRTDPDRRTEKPTSQQPRLARLAGLLERRMFFWRTDVLDALRLHLPKTATILSSLPFSDRRFSAKLKQAFRFAETFRSTMPCSSAPRT